MDIATDLDFLVEAVAGDKPTCVCRAYGGSLNSGCLKWKIKDLTVLRYFVAACHKRRS